MKLEEAIRAVQAGLIRELTAQQRDVLLTGAGMDSRSIRPGDLFVCIAGETTDGHLFAADAVRAGAAAILAERDPFDNIAAHDAPLAPVLTVPDSVKALGQLGRYFRDAFVGRTIGITGSAGKTTVKETLAHVLSMQGSVARNPMNFNTQIGLPLSMLAATGDEAFWVMEAGISRAGDMDDLGTILAPDMALIINVGQAHTQGLGLRGVAQSKAALFKYLQPKGLAIVSADYPDLVRETRKITQDAVYFSVTGKQLNYRGSYLGANAEGQGIYRLWLDGISLDVTSPMTGVYGAENIIATATAAHLLGLDPDVIVRGIAEAPLPAQRFARRQLQGWSLIDDSYNANPLSFSRMLEAAGELSRDKTLVVVAGEMLELGDGAEQEHIDLGRMLAESRASAIFWIGGHIEAVREGLKDSYFNGLFQPVQPDTFLEAFEAWNLSRKEKLEGMILFKGSRGNRMENMVRNFTDHVSGPEERHAL